MNKIWGYLMRGGSRPILRPFCCLLIAVGSTGCHVFPPLPHAVQDMGPRYHPSNIYRRADILPPQIRRVAVLPVSKTGSSAYMQIGVETLEPLLYAELEKCKRFEVIPVPLDQLRQWAGKTEWRTDEPLPPDFLARIGQGTGCDAVMFCQLTRCAPYPPIAVGWKFCLVAVPLPGTNSAAGMKDQIIWAADEVLDAGEPGVANAARDYYGDHLRNETPSADSSTILSSPARFGQYTLAALLETLPFRGMPAPAKTAKVNWAASRYMMGNDDGCTLKQAEFYGN
jgi:hypothetical protein